MSKNSIIDNQVENPETGYVYLCDNEKGEPLYFKPKSYLQEIFWEREKERSNIDLSLLPLLSNPYFDLCR
jgi:hypothetical protein